MIHSTDVEQQAVAPEAEMLLALLEDALLACSEQDLDVLHARTVAGGFLVSLSAIARRAAGDLGAAAGAPLEDGPGIVVVRDLAAATALLGRAASAAVTKPAWQPEADRLVSTAKGLHAGLLEAMTAAS